jgi:L-lactate dehydrogenase complex protein LldG
MTARDTILSRVRDALSTPAPRPHQAPAGPRVAATEARHWLPPVPSTSEALLARFAENAAALKAEFHALDSEAAAFATLARIAAAHGWKSIAHQTSALASAAAVHLALSSLPLTPGYDRSTLEAADVGITECDCLIAQTGSILLTSRHGGGRALSVLPPHHLVLARKTQLVPDLPAAYDLLSSRYGASNDWPSMITLITGPSRTGDIERILVLGAHGPKKLTLLLW